MRKHKLLAAAIVAGLSSVTLSAASPATIDDCRKIADAEERLACFDALPGSTSDVSAPASVTVATQPPEGRTEEEIRARESDLRAREAALAERESALAREREKQDQASLSKFGMNTERSPLDGVPAAEVLDRDSDGRVTAFKSKVTAFTYDAEGMVTVTLANGQIWRQFADRQLELKDSSIAYIESALLGSFKMTVDGRSRSARVERIDGRRVRH